MKKNITLYIQGVNYLSSSNTLFQGLIMFVYKLINARPNYKVAHPDWLKPEITKSENVVSVTWASNLNPFSKIRAVDILKKAIDTYRKDYNVIVVGTSLGGTIAIDALENCDDHGVSNLIIVGSINMRKRISIKGVKILNVYSHSDTLAKLAIRLLAPFSGSQELEGENVTNVSLGHARHDQLFEDLKVYSENYRDKYLSEVISSVID